MARFANAREAMDFLVAQITDESQRQGVSISEIERKMLYFSETAWTLPDIWEVSSEFDKYYDQDAHEPKIASLIRSARQRETAAWSEAIQALGDEDHYLLVMVDQASV